MKIEAAGAAFSPCGDRFVVEGYRAGLDFERQVEELSKIDGLCALPLMYPLEDYTTPERAAVLLKKYNIPVGTVCPDTYTKAKWKNGTIGAMASNVRKDAIKMIKDSMDYCAEVGGVDILLWFAHDGYDYAFEDDYETRWNYMLEGLDEVAAYRPDVKVTIEYKAKEPRIHQYISDVGKSLLLCKEIDRPNLGVVIDLGHSLCAGENPSEAAALLARYNKLFHVHLNDNYRSWDDDLLIGSVHFWETLEFFYWLNKAEYDGWYVIDIWPARIEGIKSLKESIERIRWFDKAAKSLPFHEIRKLQAENKTMDILKLVREYSFKVG